MESVARQDCPEWTSQDLENVEKLQWNLAICGCILASWGILANALSAHIFINRSASNTFNSLLILLTIADALFLIFSIMTFCRLAFTTGFVLDQILAVIYPYFVHPCKGISLTCSTYATVAMALERYLGTHHPLKHSTERNKKRWPVIAAVSSVGVNLPRFFEVELKETKDGYQVAASDLRRDETYSYYAAWFFSVVNTVGPFLILCFTNIKIYLFLKSYSQDTGIGRASQTTRGQDSGARSRTMVLLGIVLVFLTCNALRVVLNMHEITAMHKWMSCQAAGFYVIPYWTIMCADVSEFMLVVNSSVNFFIYTCFNRTFRTSVAKICSRRSGAAPVSSSKLTAIS